MENSQEELFYKASLLEKNLAELEQTLKLIDNHLFQLENFKESFKFLSQPEKEMLVPVNPGVFLKATPLNFDFFVNVGAGVIIKKSPEQTNELILEQYSKLKETRLKLFSEFELTQDTMQNLLNSLNKK
jgi:prefoldin alpha subunit